MGLILRAWDRYLSRPVAIKKLLKKNSDAGARLIREALITARLQHPAIVPIYEVSLRDSEEPFYVMKFVPGRTMAECLDDQRRNRLELLPNVLAATEAIAYAHAQRIVHRDLKPANILIGDFSETIVLDWGLATDLSVCSQSLLEVKDPYQLAAASLTQAGAVIGTPEYMSVEQAEGSSVDQRTDVYALGAILYHVLAGQPPFLGSDSKEILKKITCQKPPILDHNRLRVPAQLVAVVDKAMSRDLGHRYATATELAKDLRPNISILTTQ
jgi:serine/threonine protein kinase